MPGVWSVFNLRNFFPSSARFFIFLGYISLFVNQGVLITATKDKWNRYTYNPTTVVLLTEVLKLIVAASLQLRESTIAEFLAEIKKNLKILLLYLVPAFLYCLYNNLTFINLRNYDPATYYLLLQLRVVITGVVFQILFDKKLTRRQWLSLLMLSIGCMVKQLDFSKSNSFGFTFAFHSNLIWILVQVFCASFASVYNEYLLKGNGGNAPFHIQNVFMYAASIACNIAALQCTGTLGTAFTKKSMTSIFHIKVLAVIVNNASIGITTALFLRSLDSILKTFAGAVEPFFTAIVCWFIFGVPVNSRTFIAIAIVFYAVMLYCRNPVKNAPGVENENTRCNGHIASDPPRKAFSVV